MDFEVEQKFPVEEHGPIRTRLGQLGAECLGIVAQTDTYFAHPSRDFAQTDEALRLRRVGDLNWITYKGPKIDSRTKTRQELELPLAAGSLSFDQHVELLTALGFRPVAAVHKNREQWRLIDERPSGENPTGRCFEIEIALDDVRQVGRFVELETVAGGEDELLLAYEVINSLANDLQLGRAERRSYLELLLETSP